MCVFFAVVHAALVPAALVLAKLEAHRAGARVGVAEPRGDRATQREDRAVGLALHWLGEWASLDVLCLGCYLVHENYLKQVACSIDATTFDAATGFGSRVVYESSVKVGFQLCLVGSLTSLVAGAAVAAATSSTLWGSASVSAIGPGAFSAMALTAPDPRSFTRTSPYCCVTLGGFREKASPP